MAKILPLVSISCITYNQASYIRQCLDGFLMQKTNFAYEVLIHDDCSTDGTTEIIREYEAKYPHIIKPLYEEENQYVKGRRGSRTFNFPRAQGKYIALCEGDDYWIDPLKLQKQVDFLEANPEYGMCYTQCLYFYQKTQLHGDKPWGGSSETFDEFMNNNTVPTLTAMFRKELYQKYEVDVCPNSKNWMMGDYPMWLWMSYMSRIKYMPFVSGIYRVLDSSASHSKDVCKKIEFGLNTIEILQYFNDKFNYGLDCDYFNHRKCILTLRSYAIHNELVQFVKSWICAIKKYPTMLFHKDMYKYIFFFLFPNIRNKRL